VRGTRGEAVTDRLLNALKGEIDGSEETYACGAVPGYKKKEGTCGKDLLSVSQATLIWTERMSVEKAECCKRKQEQLRRRSLWEVKMFRMCVMVVLLLLAAVRQGQKMLLAPTGCVLNQCNISQTESWICASKPQF